MKKTRILAAALATLLLLSGCGGKTEDPYAASGKGETTPTAAPVQTEPEPTPAEVVVLPEEDSGFDFSQLKDWTFDFSSGAGAWWTELKIAADGSFTGHFQDSDMGDVTDEHPNGVQYVSDFEGRFTQPEQVNDYTVSFRIDEIRYPQGERTEIVDGVLYEYRDAYGLAGAEELLLYLPGAPVSELPEMYLNWVRGHFLANEENMTELPGYGLYNVKEENGFSSHFYGEDGGTDGTGAEINAPEEAAFDPALALELAIDEAQTEAMPLEEQLSQAATQADMNEAANAIYQVWDGALNRFWKTLKEHLPEEEMQALTKEQLKWIAEKEAAVQEQNDALAGGTAAPLAAATVATDYTKDRMYELLEHFRGN